MQSFFDSGKYNNYVYKIRIAGEITKWLIMHDILKYDKIFLIVLFVS